MKGMLIAVLLIVAAVTADKYLNYGLYTDGAISMLREIQRSFGF